MANDRRIKGCPNDSCELHINKVRQKPFYDYCPKCGTKLIFVCQKCFNEIEDIDETHKICRLCEVNAIQKRTKEIEKVKKVGATAGKTVAGVVAPIAVGIAGKVIKDGQNVAIKNSVKIVESAAKMVLKK